MEGLKIVRAFKKVSIVGQKLGSNSFFVINSAIWFVKLHSKHFSDIS